MLFVKVCQWEAYDLNMLLYFILPVLYSAVYAVTAFYHQPHENEAIGRGNIAIALFYFVALYFLNNPIYPVTYQFGAAKHVFPVQQIHPQTMHPNQPIQSVPLPIVPQDRQTAMQDQIKHSNEQLAKQGLTWSSTLTDQAYVAGFRGQDKLYICRAKFNNDFQIGMLSQNQCLITYGGMVYPQGTYEILEAKSGTQFNWQPINAGLGIPLGYEFVNNPDGSFHIRPLSACRLIADGHITLGKVVSGRCNYAQDGRELANPSAETFAY